MEDATLDDWLVLDEDAEGLVIAPKVVVLVAMAPSNVPGPPPKYTSSAGLGVFVADDDDEEAEEEDEVEPPEVVVVGAVVGSGVGSFGTLGGVIDTGGAPPGGMNGTV